MKLKRVSVRQKDYIRGERLICSEDATNYAKDILKEAEKPMLLMSMLNVKCQVVSTTVVSVSDFNKHKEEILGNIILSGGNGVIAADTYKSETASRRLCGEVSELVMGTGTRMLDYINVSKEKKISIPEEKELKAYDLGKGINLDSGYITNNMYLDEEGSLNIKKPTIGHAINAIAHDLSTRDREHFGVLNLDEYDEPINYSIISIGTVDQAVVGMHESLKTPLLSEAKSCVFFHNHPSGDLTKSEGDIETDEQLRNALSKFGITVRDNIIIGDNAIYSFSMDTELSINHDVERKEEFEF